MIYGIKAGKSEIQALRYDRRKWTAGAARTHCSSRGGTFEAAPTKAGAEGRETMKIPMHLLQAELTVEKNKDGRFADLKWYTGATIRRMSWDGKYFLTLSMNPEHVRM